MQILFNSEIVVLVFILAVFFLAKKLQQKTGILLLNPILISIIFIVIILLVFNIEYESFDKGSRFINFMLKPAVVALGFPLYNQLERIKKQAVPIIVSQLFGCIAGVVSVVLIAKAMGASKEVIFSLAPKSVTTPIALEISSTLGGIPALTASVTVVVGIFGSIVGYSIFKISRVKNPLAQGIAMGTAAHAVGTSKSMEISPNYGAMSSLGLIVNGIFTAILAPIILRLLGIWISF